MKTTVTLEEAHQSLLVDWLEPDTEAYFIERARRYYPDTEASSGQAPRLAERDDWDPRIPVPVAVYSDEEVALVIQRFEGHEPGTIDSWNARSRLFEPVGAGNDDHRWRKKGNWSSVLQEPKAKAVLPKRSASKAVGTGFAFVDQAVA